MFSIHRMLLLAGKRLELSKSLFLMFSLTSKKIPPPPSAIKFLFPPTPYQYLKNPDARVYFPSEPVSQYICMNPRKLVKLMMMMIEHIKMMQILTYGHCIFPNMRGWLHVKWSKPEHDPSQNLIKICQVFTICQI